ncbi:MAG: DUF721 domain-containing protein [Maricaulaceae bacterium]
MNRTVKNTTAQSDPSAPSREDNAKIQAWLSTQRGRPQYRPSPAIGRAAAKIVKPFAAKFGTGITPIVQSWPEIIGRRFAKISRPSKLSGKKNERVLTIEAAAPVGALILASSGQILQRLNTFLGHDTVKHLKITQESASASDRAPMKTPIRALTPDEEIALQSSLENISDDGLRSALENFGRKMLGTQTHKPRL